MADSNIAGLPAGAAVISTDLIAGSNAGSGTLVKKTAAQLQTFILGNQGVKSFGAVGDAKKITDGNTTGGSNTLTSVTAGFVAGDVGKVIWAVVSEGTVIFSSRTITAVNSSTSVTVSGAAFSSFLNLIVVWGTDDTAAIQAAGIDAITNKYNIYFPPGGYIISEMLFDFRFSVTTDAPSIIGAGSGQTSIYINPDFDFSTVPATYSAILAAANVYRQNMSGFTLDGCRARVNASAFSAIAIHGNGGFVEDVWVLYMNGYRSGLQIVSTQTFMSKCHVEACSDLGTDVNGCAVTFFECYTGNCGAYGLLIQGVNGGANTGFYVRWVGGIVDESTISAAYVEASSDISFIGAKLFGGVGGYALTVDGTSNVRVTSSEIVCFGTNNGNRGGLHVLSGGVCSLGQTRVSGSGTSFAINNAGTIINTGGNDVTGTVTGALTSTLLGTGLTLPTEDPNVVGQLWNKGGLVAISGLFTRALAGNTGAYAMSGHTAGFIPSLVTWNPSDKSAHVTLSNGNLTATLVTNDFDSVVRANNSNTEGYFEITFTNYVTGMTGDVGLGLANLSQSLSSYIGDPSSNGLGYYPTGFISFNDSFDSASATCLTGDILGIELTITSTVKFSKNGTVFSTYSGTLPTGDLYPAISLEHNTDSFTANFGKTAMAFLPVGVTSWDGSRTG